jgi:hypothetical protein
MALSKLVFKPGINRDQTNYSSEGGWYSMDKVRFRSGFPEKIGGWEALTQVAYVGSARSINTWATSDGSELVGLGTSSKVYIAASTNLYDITPIRATFTSPATDNCFEITSGNPIVTVNIVDHGGQDGDFVSFSGVTGSPGGLADSFYNREFQIANASGSTFTITLADTPVSSSVGAGGTAITARFDIPIGNVRALAGYGWGAGTWSRGAWGSGTVVPIYEPARLIFQDTFNDDMIFNTRYTGSVETTEAELTDGFIYYWYYDKTFSNRAVLMSSIPGAIAVPTRVGKIMFTPNGHLLALGCTTYGFAQSPGAAITSITRGGTGNLTATVNTAAAHGLSNNDWVEMVGQSPVEYVGTYQVTVVDADTFTYQMVSAPATNAVTVGTYSINNYTGAYDALSIRWANVDPDLGPQPQQWEPTETNTAGFFRLTTGSEIVTGENARQETLIWTDSTISSLQPIGTDEVFSLQLLSSEISIISPNVVTQANNVVYWMGRDKFYSYSGRVDTLPCTLRQYIFQDINTTQADTFFAGTNNQFNELVWFYCSQNSEPIDRYVIYNYAENIWYYGTLNRTCWADASIIDYPVSASNGYLYLHEKGHDDGQPLAAPPLPINAYIQSADVDIDDGDKFMLIRRVIPDINFTDSTLVNIVTGESQTPEATVTVGVRNFPGAQQQYATANPEEFVNAEGEPLGRAVTSQYFTTAVINNYTNQVFIRARGRQMSFKISSNNLGTQWQLGMPRVDARPDGTRG